ncbi:MAG: hypothetical protein J6U23_11375 [Clostridiales bacterium]|nr:hypothetical protein [Clostridiales bacterium]
MKFVNKGLLISVCCMLLIAGCSSTTNETTVSDVSTEARITEQETTEVQETEASTEVQETEVSDESVDQSSEITLMKIVDITDDMYEDKLEYTLTPEQVSTFIEIQDELSVCEKGAGWLQWYELEMYGQDDGLIDILKVDMNYHITDSTGQTYESGKLEDWLKSTEESFDMSYSAFRERIPSDNYFMRMSEGFFGELDEKAETNFDEVLSLDLNETDINELSDALENVEFAKEATTDIAKKYSIIVYGRNGGCLYEIFVDEDMHIYTDFGYEITGGTIKDWVEERIE